MQRLLGSAFALAVIVTLTLGVNATLTPEGQFYGLVGAQLVGVILAVVLVSSLFTVIYLVAFGSLGRRWIENRFSLFVGWTLLRSQRVGPDAPSRLRSLIWETRTQPSKRAKVRIVWGLALIVVGFTFELIPAWNALSEAFSPVFTRVLQFSCVGLGALTIVLAAPGLLSNRPSHAPVPHLRTRTAVTLPTFISIVGVSIGVWALVVVLSVMHGFETDLRQKILRTNAHVVVEAADSAGDLGDGYSLADPIRELPNIAETHAYVGGEVMMASGSNIAVNVMVKGMRTRDLLESEQLRGQMKAGDLRWLDEPEQVPSDRIRYPAPSAQLLDGLAPVGGLGQTKQANLDLLPTVVLGVELANSLSVDVGQQIRIISPDGDIGPTGLRPKLRSYRVAGIFATGMYEYDQKLAYMAIDDAQRFFNFDATVNQIEIRLKDASLTDASTRSVREVIAGSTIKAKVTDWQERNKSLFAALQLERIVMFIVLGFIILVASLLIVSSLVMLIVEKAREIAVFKALGAADHTIVRTFLLIGSVIGAIGSASGLTLGIGTCLAIEHLGIPLPQEYYISRLPVAMDVGEVAVVGAAAFFICVLATIYPSREASALKAVEGLRHG